MKWKQYDIFLLLGCLFLFSCGIGWFHVGKKGQQISLQTLVDVAQTVINQQSRGQDTILSELSDEEILIYLKVLIASRSVEKIVDNLKGLPVEKALHIYTMIAQQGSSALLSWDRKELLVLLAASYIDQAEQDAVLSASERLAELQKDGPLLVTAAHLDDYRTLIPLVYGWYKRTHTPSQVEEMTAKTYEHVIAKNASDHFKRLVEYGVPITQKMATRLVHYVVDNKKDAQFITLLSAFNPDWNNHGPDGVTPLIKASRDSNYSLVDALLKAGVDPNFRANDLIGSALQNVMRLVLNKDSKKDVYEIRKLIEIELLLRSYGAFE